MGLQASSRMMFRWLQAVGGFALQAGQGEGRERHAPARDFLSGRRAVPGSEAALTGARQNNGEGSGLLTSTAIPWATRQSHELPFQVTSSREAPWLVQEQPGENGTEEGHGLTCRNSRLGREQRRAWLDVQELQARTGKEEGVV